MSCEIVKLPGGATALVKRPNQRPRHCSVCKRLLKQWKLCDFPTGSAREGKPRTCDRVLCTACATHRDPDLDYCPAHAAMMTPEGRLRL